MNNNYYLQILILSAIIVLTNIGWTNEILVNPYDPDRFENTSFFEHKMVFKDVEGNDVDVSKQAKDKITVLRFWSSECPHSRSFDKPMLEMYNEYHPKVTLFDVNSNWKIDVEYTKSVRDDARLTVPMIVDANGLLAKAFQAKTNAEFLVFDPDGVLVYKGTYYVRKTGENEAGVITIRDLIKSLLAQKPVQPAEIRAGGCMIQCCPFIQNKELPILFHGTSLVNALREKIK